MFYSAGMPLLYPIVVASLMGMYWLDKVLLLKIYKIPKKIDEGLANLVRVVLLWILIFHIALAIWIYGNSDLFDADTDILNNDQIFRDVEYEHIPYVFLTFGVRSIAEQNRPLLGMLVVSFIAVALHYSDGTQKILVSLVRKVFRRPAPHKAYEVDKDYFSLLKYDDIKNELIFLEKRITDAKSEDYKKYLEKKKQVMSEALNKQSGGFSNFDSKNHFIGYSSYFIGFHEDYRQYCIQKNTKLFID